MKEKLFLYYTNDLHSHFENWSKIVGYFNDKKIQRKSEKQSYWLVDIGDHVDRFHPISEALMGKANVELLNQAGYNIATIGNNEGITLDYNDLYHLYDDATFQLVCSNLQSTQGDNPSWLQATHNVTSIHGVTVAFVGLTAPFNAFYNLLGWNIESPFDSLDHYIQTLNQEVDIIVLLSHLGINEDQEIARRFKQIDVIIGGHTHHMLRDGEYVEGTLLTAAGKHGHYVGEVILTWDHQTKQLVHKEAYTTSIKHYAEDKQTAELLEAFQDKANHLLQETVTTLQSPLEVDWFKETLVIKKLVETLKDWTQADCAMLNAGLLLDRFEAGKVSYGDVHRICPHPINPCLVELKGKELIEVIRGSFTQSFMELNLKGFGFRGEVIGRMVFAGVEVAVRELNNGTYQVTDVSMYGSPIQPNEVYRVATADTFTFGSLLPEISRSRLKKFFMPEFLRDLLISTLKHKI